MAGLRKGYADSRLGQVHFAVLGEGPPLILLGPAPRSYRGLIELAGVLAPRFRCVMVDQPGFGESTPMPADATMEDVADAVVPVLDALAIERADVFGLHSGLKVATALAARHPERVGRLVLCGKSHSIAPDMAVRNKATHAVVDRYYFTDGAGPSGDGVPMRGWAACWRNLSALWWNDGLVRADAPQRLMAATEAKIADDLLARPTVLESYRANFAFDLAAALAQVQAPTTVIEITSAAEDSRIGRQGTALAALAPHGVSRELPEIDPGGLLLYVGVEILAGAVKRVLEPA